MPSKSKSQQRLFGMAEHNPSALFPADKALAQLPHKVLHEFAATTTKQLPNRVLDRAFKAGIFVR